MSCFWCGREDRELTEDHVIPESLGGTREYIVLACLNCQTVLSKAEHEVARKSNMAIAALASGVKPRHPDRATSGHLRPSYLLVKHPFGGYGETLLSTGERLAALPHIEIRVVPGEPVEGRVRGPSAEAAQRLVETFRNMLANPLGPNNFVGEMTGNCELDDEICDDPDFWPRIVLLPGDRLMVRGRDPEEMTRFARALTNLIVSGYNVNPATWQKGEDIKGGTHHWVAFHFDPQCVRRVVAKVAFGIFHLSTCRPLAADRLLREYVRGASAGLDEPVWVEPHPPTMTTSGSPHIVVLSPGDDPTAALVSLYGYRFRVELGEDAVLPEPVVVFCNIDGSGMHRAKSCKVKAAIASFQGADFGQPWKATNETMAGNREGGS